MASPKSQQDAIPTNSVARLLPIPYRPGPQRRSSNASDDTIEIPRSFSPPAASYAWSASDESYMPAFSLDGHRISDSDYGHEFVQHYGPDESIGYQYPFVHYCGQCDAWRSEAFHQANPLMPGMRPITVACEECREKQSTSKASFDSEDSTVSRETKISIRHKQTSPKPAPQPDKKPQGSLSSRTLHIYEPPPERKASPSTAESNATSTGRSFAAQARSASPPRSRQTSPTRVVRPKYVIERYLAKRPASPVQLPSPPRRPREISYRHVEVLRQEPAARKPREMSRSLSPRLRSSSTMNDSDWYYEHRTRKGSLTPPREKSATSPTLGAYDLHYAAKSHQERPLPPSLSTPKVDANNIDEKPEWYYEKVIRRVAHRHDDSTRDTAAGIRQQTRDRIYSLPRTARGTGQKLPSILKRTVSAPPQSHRGKGTAYPSMSGALREQDDRLRDADARVPRMPESSYLDRPRPTQRPIGSRIASDLDKPKSTGERLRRQEPSPPSPEPRARSYQYAYDDKYWKDGRAATPSTVSSQKRVQFAPVGWQREEPKGRPDVRHDQNGIERAKKRVRENIEEGSGAFEMMH